MLVDRPNRVTRPLRREGAPAVELDDNLALYDEAGQFLILLNASATAVWELCDGATTPDDMVRLLTGRHPEQAAAIEDDVRLTLGKLTELGLVTDADASEEATG